MESDINRLAQQIARYVPPEAAALHAEQVARRATHIDEFAAMNEAEWDRLVQRIQAREATIRAAFVQTAPAIRRMWRAIQAYHDVTNGHTRLRPPRRAKRRAHARRLRRGR